MTEYILGKKQFTRVANRNATCEFCNQPFKLFDIVESRIVQHRAGQCRKYYHKYCWNKKFI